MHESMAEGFAAATTTSFATAKRPDATPMRTQPRTASNGLRLN